MPRRRHDSASSSDSSSSGRPRRKRARSRSVPSSSASSSASSTISSYSSLSSASSSSAHSRRRRQGRAARPPGPRDAPPAVQRDWDRAGRGPRGRRGGRGRGLKDADATADARAGHRSAAPLPLPPAPEVGARGPPSAAVLPAGVSGVVGSPLDAVGLNRKINAQRAVFAPPSWAAVPSDSTVWLEGRATGPAGDPAGNTHVERLVVSDAPWTVFGNSKRCDYSLSHPSMGGSSVFALIIHKSGSVYIVDLRRPGGTFSGEDPGLVSTAPVSVNGSVITYAAPQKLSPGDVITIRGLPKTYTVCVGPPARRAPASAAEKIEPT